MRGWSCDEIDEFSKLQNIYLCDCFMFKGTQTIVFIGLSAHIIYKLFKDTGGIGVPALAMSLLAMLNGIFSIIRVSSAFPIFTDDVRGYLLICSYCVEYLGQLGAAWLFAIKYYEAAGDLQMMLEDVDPTTGIAASSSPISVRLSKRKKIYKWVSWGVFMVLVAILATIMSLMCVTNKKNDITENAYSGVRVIGACFIILTLLSIAIGVLMVLALRTFVKVVKNSSQRDSLNQCFVWLQVICVLLLGALWCGCGYFLIRHYKSYRSYEPVKMIMILESIGFFACFLFFMIMAKVIYKSSQVQRNRLDAEDECQKVSLMAYMRSECAHEAGQSIKTKKLANNLGMVVVPYHADNSSSNKNSSRDRSDTNTTLEVDSDDDMSSDES